MVCSQCGTIHDCLSFIHLFRAAFEVSSVEEDAMMTVFKEQPQDVKNEVVREWARIAGWCTEDKAGIGGIVYASFYKCGIVAPAGQNFRKWLETSSANIHNQFLSELRLMERLSGKREQRQDRQASVMAWYQSRTVSEEGGYQSVPAAGPMPQSEDRRELAAALGPHAALLRMQHAARPGRGTVQSLACSPK
eukprot:TRINITY_DN52635_c0_g1_i1.p1 TRINITY_DN52635_c0_g1~~TRINITY_DN52635_c0_g1_i1.p1  ORF type:complete len:192 (-),score=32.04 TRINITY_DN52635_c0_g1_i1:131-706(-)